MARAALHSHCVRQAIFTAGWVVWVISRLGKSPTVLVGSLRGEEVVMMTAQRSERGQALVLIILAIVGMMGFAALAVDLGRAYAERRRAQSAVDAAALGGAYVCSQREDIDNPCNFDTFIDAAEPLMQENDYYPSPTVEIFYDTPPVGGPYDGEADYFQVRLRTKIDPIFAQFVYGGPMNIEVEAVTRSTVVDSISPGNAITATRRDICPGVVLNGGMTGSVTGGNIFSNSEGTNNGSCFSAISTGSSGSLTLVNSELVVAGQFRPTGNNPDQQLDINGDIIQSAGFQSFPTPPEPYCDDLEEGTVYNDTHVLGAGKHTSLPNSFGNSDWTLEQGMHCFYTTITKNGGWLRSSGYGVFIVMKQGGISISGNAQTNLRAVFGGPDGHGLFDGHQQQWSGMLIYMSPTNTNGIDLSGTGEPKFTGTIYAGGPRDPASQEKCNIGGNNETIALKAALICSSVGIAGGANVTIVYNPTQNYRMPPTVELVQ
jgi:hypothetical protein